MLKGHQKQAKLAQDADFIPVQGSLHAYVAPEIEVIDIEIGTNVLAESFTSPSEGEEWP